MFITLWWILAIWDILLFWTAALIDVDIATYKTIWYNILYNFFSTIHCILAGFLCMQAYGLGKDITEIEQRPTEIDIDN